MSWAAMMRSKSSPLAPIHFMAHHFWPSQQIHPLALELAEGNAGLTAFIEECNRMGTSQASIEQAEKKGFDTGLRVCTSV